MFVCCARSACNCATTQTHKQWSRGGSKGGGRLGRSLPIKPTKVSLFTMILYNSENSLRNIIRKTVSLIRPNCQILLNSLPLTLQAGSDPAVKRSKRRAMRYIYRIKFRMLKVFENEIALRKLPDGTAHLRGCAPHREHWSQAYSFLLVLHETVLRVRLNPCRGRITRQMSSCLNQTCGLYYVTNERNVGAGRYHAAPMKRSSGSLRKTQIHLNVAHGREHGTRSSAHGISCLSKCLSVACSECRQWRRVEFFCRCVYAFACKASRFLCRLSSSVIPCPETHPPTLQRLANLSQPPAQTISEIHHRGNVNGRRTAARQQRLQKRCKTLLKI